MFFFERLELAEELVVLGVRDLRIVQDVVTIDRGDGSSSESSAMRFERLSLAEFLERHRS